MQAPKRTPKTNIICDSRPLVLFAEVFKAVLQIRKRSLDLRDLGFELARAELNVGAAGTDELVMRLYPSNAFLRLATAVLAGKFDLGTIKETNHKHLRKRIKQ